jgi:hypothetical protein
MPDRITQMIGLHRIGHLGLGKHLGSAMNRDERNKYCLKSRSF